jgi:hypothetical protein
MTKQAGAVAVSKTGRAGFEVKGLTQEKRREMTALGNP